LKLNTSNRDRRVYTHNWCSDCMSFIKHDGTCNCPSFTKCKYLVGTWCHNNVLDFQEECNFYLDQTRCPNYKKGD